MTRHLRLGVLVVLDPATQPGTTAEVVRGRLEETVRVARSDSWLASSPQRSTRGSALGYPFRFAGLAQEINVRMPAYVAQRALLLLNSGGGRSTDRPSCCSASPTSRVSDTRESPAAPLARRLRELGSVVQYHDPLDVVAGARLRDDLGAGPRRAPGPV